MWGVAQSGLGWGNVHLHGVRYRSPRPVACQPFGLGESGPCYSMDAMPAEGNANNTGGYAASMSAMPCS